MVHRKTSPRSSSLSLAGVEGRDPSCGLVCGPGDRSGDASLLLTNAGPSRQSEQDRRFATCVEVVAFIVMRWAPAAVGASMAELARC